MERKLIRQDPSLPGVTEFLLTSIEYERLIADGHDPATVTGRELAPSVKIIRGYDEHGRLIREVAIHTPEAVIVTYPETDA